MIRTENNLKASLLELKRAMNFPVQEELPLQDIPEVDIQQSVAFENADSVFLMALDHLPEVRSKVSQLKAVEKSLVMAKGELYPSVSL